MKKAKKKINNKVIKLVVLVSLFLGISFQNNPDAFKNSQIKYKNVKTAYTKKWDNLQKLLKEKGIEAKNFEIHLRSFKSEKQLEIWCRNKGEVKFVLVKTMDICASSGGLGPKRKEGDGQVPEGFYEVNWFNPMSDYHLGLKINYPNQSDRIKATGSRPGGDIMIHGNCVTIGCIPLQDDPIEELYVLCVESKNKKNDVGVSIYPCRLTKQNYEKLSKNGDADKIKVWSALKQAYQYFEDNKQMPKVKVNKNGDYEVKG
jgi:murein L,D-transpeptidase YafK